MTHAAPARHAAPPVDLSSELLGPLSVRAERVFHFPAGLVGLPECRDFALLDGRPGLFWLQSLEHAALTFLLADPFAWVEGFHLELDLPPVPGRAPEDELAVLAIVTLPRDPGAAATLNLQGPLLLSFSDGTGRQLVLPRSAWGIRHPIDLSAGAPRTD